MRRVDIAPDAVGVTLPAQARHVFVPEVDNFTYARAVQQPVLGVADGRGSYFTHYRGNYG